MDTFFHPDQLLHEPKFYFSRGKMRAPSEVPERAIQLLEAVHELGFVVKKPLDYGMRPLLDVHSFGYLRFLETAYRRWKEMPADWGDEVVTHIYVREPNALRGIQAEAARYQADGSCPIGESTWRSAYWSAQSAVAGAHALLDGGRCAYSLCRPPGHHACVDTAGGLCYLNNCAIAAQALRKKYDRVLVLDTDLHHGQGIQQIFYDRDDVFYVSIHADPTNFYPAVSGYEEERGRGKGYGCNVNLTMPHGAGEDCFFERLDEAIETVRAFEPDAIVLALGFDIYKDDWQSKVVRLGISGEGFQRLGRAVKSLELPTLVVQEGGYHFETLGNNLKGFFNGLLQ